MDAEYKTRVNLKLTQVTHKALKIWCAEREVTLQVGATRLIEEGIKRKVGGAAAMGMVEVAPGTWRHPEVAVIGEPLPQTYTQRLSDDPKAALYAAGFGPAQRTVEMVPLATSQPGLQAHIEEATRYRIIEDEVPTEADINPIEDEEERLDPDEAWAAYMKQGVSVEQAWAGMRQWCQEEDLEGWQPPQAKTLRSVIAPAAAPWVEDSAKGPVTSKEFDVPENWVDAAGATRAANLKRFGEDEAIEYWPPVEAPGLDIDAPVDLTGLKPHWSAP